MADENGDLNAEQGEEAPAAESSERPDWLESRYATVEDQAKAYSEANKKISEQGRELGQLRESMDEMLELMQQAPAPAQPYQDPNQNPLVQDYQRAYEEGDARKMLEVQAQLAQAIVQQQMEAQAKSSGDTRQLDPYLIGQMRDQIAERYEADEAMQAKAFEIMENHPVVSQRLQQLSDDPTATIGDLAPVVDTAYQLAKGEFVSQEQQSLAQQQQEREVARRRKVDQESLNSSGPTRTASKSEQKDAWDRIMAADDGKLRLGPQ